MILNRLQNWYNQVLVVMEWNGSSSVDVLTILQLKVHVKYFNKVP